MTAVDRPPVTDDTRAETTTEWGVRGMDVTLRAGSEQDARELLAKSADYVLVRREVGPWTEDVQ